MCIVKFRSLELRSLNCAENVGFLRNRHFVFLSRPEIGATWFHSQLKCSGGNHRLPE